MPVAQPHPWQKVLKYSPMKGTKAKKVCSILEVLCFLFAHSDYRKSSIKLPPPGELFISCPFDGGGSLIETGGLFNFRNNDVISSPCRTTIQSGKAQVQEVLGHAAEDQNQIRSSSW